MTIAESIPDAISLAKSLGDLCLFVAIVGCVFTLVACACVYNFPGEDTAEPAAQPPVTVLKPLHDTEPGLPARLAAFCRQDYGAPVQILCGVRDHASPAAAVVQAMEVDFPDRRIELLVEPRSHGVNRKVSNLINMMPRVRHDTLVLSDSDIVVGPNYLRAVTALLAAPRAGAITCLYYGIGGEGLWTRLSALAINAQFLPHAVTAVSLGLAKPCFGATIALRRSTLDRIGGFGALADVLADDHAIGVAIRSQGYDVVTAPFLVGHHCFEGSLRQLIRHQIRVARTIKSIDPIGYAGTIITHPWPLALLALILGSPAQPWLLSPSCSRA
jgi:ceramide glucosyltransferase